MIEVGQYYKGTNEDDTTIVYKIIKKQEDWFRIVILKDDDGRPAHNLHRGQEVDIPDFTTACWIVQATLLEGQELAWELI